MTRRLWVASAEAGTPVTLAPDTAHHAHRVLRLDVGADVLLFDGRGSTWKGRLAAAGKRGVSVDVLSALPREPRACPRLVLATAVPKGPRMGRLLAMAAEAGVDAVLPVQCARSSDKPASEKKRAHWEKALVEASRQSGRAWIPTLEPGRSLSDLLEMPSDPATCRLVASTSGGPAPLAQVLDQFQPPAKVLVLVGPEGGLTDEEDAASEAAGFAPCSLGPHILRVETAAAVAVALVRAAIAGA